MIESKPIEPGCLAIVTNSIWSQFIGVTIEVVSYIGEAEKLNGDKLHDQWEIAFKGTKYVIRESWLMRIDDPDIQKQIESEQELAV